MNRIEIRKKYMTENGIKHLDRIETQATYTRWLEKELGVLANRLDALVSRAAPQAMQKPIHILLRQPRGNPFSRWELTESGPYCDERKALDEKLELTRKEPIYSYKIETRLLSG